MAALQAGVRVGPYRWSRCCPETGVGWPRLSSRRISSAGENPPVALKIAG